MGRPAVPRIVVSILLIVAIVLPIAICVVVGVAALLSAMDDAAGATVLGRLALAGGVLWAINLICLVLIQAVNTLGDEEERSEAQRPKP